MLDTEFIKTRRDKLGLTQEQAAKAGGIPNRHVWNRLEMGHAPNVRPDTLLKLAKALRCPVGKLLKAK